jgi:hypothetical protein
MSVYVGIDVHRKRSQVAAVAEDGQVQPVPDTWSWQPPRTPRAAPDGCLRDHSASDTGEQRDPHNQHGHRSSPLSDDPSPLAGLKLVRPRRCAAAGAPARPLQHGDVNQAAAKKIPKNSQAQPGDTTQKPPGHTSMPS